MIKSVFVEKIFGSYDHLIPFKIESGITIIYGENGVGKTIVLKILEAFFDGNFNEIHSYFFSTFCIQFSNEDQIVLHKNVTEAENFLEITYLKKDGDTLNHTINFFDENSRLRTRIYSGTIYREQTLKYEIERFLPSFINRLSADTWLDNRLGKIFSTNDIIKRYSKHFPPRYRESLLNSIPDWLTEVINSIQVKLIDTQRLLVKSKDEVGKYTPTLETLSKKLTDIIRNTRAEATDLAIKLDRTYVNRLIDQIANFEQKEYNNLELELEELVIKRNLLDYVGLADSAAIEPIKKDIRTTLGRDEKIFKAVLDIYIQDSKQKLAKYDDLAYKLRLLL
ncbi:MAG: ATP-binding protein, partial [Pyrinomonadaceae bacterium]|nr:ATP-binding protein [Sphingobacteriaceae bacterium]